MNLEPAQAALRDQFLGWQCRLRQFALRQGDGRPTSGMRPRLSLPDGTVLADATTVLLVPREAAASTMQFRHIVRYTHDPRERYEKAVQYLAATHYQRPRDFGDVMTALFLANSDIVAGLTHRGSCVLEFEQFGQSFRIPCSIVALAQGDQAYQSTYWHNSLFNPHIPPDITVLGFVPDWARAGATPPV